MIILLKLKYRSKRNSRATVYSIIVCYFTTHEHYPEKCSQGNYGILTAFQDRGPYPTPVIPRPHRFFLVQPLGRNWLPWLWHGERCHSSGCRFPPRFLRQIFRPDHTLRIFYIQCFSGRQYLFLRHKIKRKYFEKGLAFTSKICKLWGTGEEAST